MLRLIGPVAESGTEPVADRRVEPAVRWVSSRALVPCSVAFATRLAGGNACPGPRRMRTRSAVRRTVPSGLAGVPVRANIGGDRAIGGQGWIGDRADIGWQVAQGGGEIERGPSSCQTPPARPRRKPMRSWSTATPLAKVSEAGPKRRMVCCFQVASSVRSATLRPVASTVAAALRRAGAPAAAAALAVSATPIASSGPLTVTRAVAPWVAVAVTPSAVRVASNVG